MRFSVVMQCYLGPYQHAATNREEKLIRAINSLLNGVFQDFELLIIADGCEKTFDIIQETYKANEKIDCILIHKQKLWSGKPRNEGIKRAKGQYIVYLDSDDQFGLSHLQIINEQLLKYKNPDWVYFNDILIEKDGRKVERNIVINQRYQNGTSNICHKKDLMVEWNGTGYGEDDWSIVKQLNGYLNRVKIQTPEYYVCHLPGKLDV